MKNAPSRLPANLAGLRSAGGRDLGLVLVNVVFNRIRLSTSMPMRTAEEDDGSLDEKETPISSVHQSNWFHGRGQSAAGGA